MAYTYEQVYAKTSVNAWPYWSFLKYGDDLVIYDYFRPDDNHGQALITSDGNNWTQLFEVDNAVSGIGPQSNPDVCDYALIEYNDSIWLTQYSAIPYTNAKMLEWDGSDTLIQHLNDATVYNNYGTYSPVVWAGYLWIVSDYSPMITNRRVIYFYSPAGGWTLINDYDGDAAILYNTTSYPDVRYRNTRLFVFGGSLYLFATQWNSDTSQWGWQVWRFNTTTWAEFNLIYEVYEDYAMADVVLYGTRVLVFANKLNLTGTLNDDARYYGSYDLVNWDIDGTVDGFGAIMSTTTFCDQFFINAWEIAASDTLIYNYSLITKEATLEERITNLTAGAFSSGGIVSWEDDLYIGKSREVMRRTPREEPSDPATVDDEVYEDEIVVLTKWAFRAADGTIINYRMAPIDVRGPSAFYEGRILSMSGAERSTDDRSGLPAVGDMTVEIANHDKAISILLHSYPIWKNQIVQVWYAKRNKPEAMKSETSVMIVADYYEKGPNYVVVLKDLNRKYFDIEIPEEMAT